MRTVYAQKNKKIILGRQGEDKAVRVVWPGIVSDWSSLYGDGSFQLSVRRFGDENAYPVVVEVNGDDVCFTVTSAETAIAGNGKCELTYIANGTIAKSATWETVVLNSLTGQAPSEPPEEPAKSWVTSIQGQIGNLAELATTSKDNLVAAINEAAQSGGGGGSAVELDTTLTQSGKAADAKAVGDALAANQHLFDSAVFFDENTELLEWEFGGLYSNGGKFDSESCIRTKKIKVAVGTTFFLKELFAGNGGTRVVFYDDSGAKLDSRHFYIGMIDNVALFREISVTNDMDGAWCALSVEIDTEKYPRANYSIDDYVSIYFGGVRDNPYFKIAPNEEFNAETRRTVSDVMGGDMGRLRFLHVSDTHLGINEWSQNAMHNGYNMLFGSMVETAKKLNCDFILHTGDVIAGSADIDDSTPWKQTMLHFKEVVKEAGMPVIVCRGNHDDNSVGTPSASKVIDNTWWNNNMNIMLNEYCKDFVFPADNTGYYYYNIPSKKIRVVNINSEDLTDAERVSVGGQNYAVVSQNQLNWLDTDAFVVPDGWKIICVSHISCASGQPNMGISNDSDLMSIITAHKDDILAYVYGHTHMSVNYVDESTGIQFISTIPCGIKAKSVYVQSGRNSSYPSDSAYASSPTGRFVFDVCKLVENRIERTRWGVQDDTFQA